MEWTVELLGGLRLHAEGQTITRFRTQRAASLLAYLCFYPRQHARDTLADLFWPDADIDSARANLRQALSQIRASVKAVGLDPDTLLDTPGKNAVGIDTRYVRTDVAAFLHEVDNRQASLARQRYGGTLLPGLWDDWLLDERDRLEAIYQSLETAPDPARLPLPLSRFFGRQQEMAQLTDWLLPGQGNRLVTLLGTGGVGKTRLALTASDSLREPFGERISFVPLAALTDSRLLMMAILTGLEAPAGQPDDEPLDQLARYVGDEPYLLVLDNLEQLAGTVAAPLKALLARVPNLTCLATSRRRLGMEGERLLPVDALDVDESVALFCDRAGIRPDNSVERLCALLEGIPLALELAANRVGALAVEEMIEKIGERLTFLTTQETDKTARHRSLHAVMDWSVRLLTRDQRRLFAMLSVFRGGWTSEAAEAVCSEPAALEYLSQLRDRSLALAEERRGRVRWRMGESLREFGESLLTDLERETLVLGHGEYFTDFARTNQRALLGSEVAIHQQYEAELENFRSALTELPPQLGVRLLAELVNFFMVAGLLREGAAWIEQVCVRVDTASGSHELGTLLSRGVVLYHYLRRFDDAIRCGLEGVRLLREFADPKELAQALCILSYMYGETDQSDRAKPLLEEALQIGEREKNQVLTAECQAALGKHHYHQGQLVESIRYSQDALRSARTLHRTNLVNTLLNNLATTYLDIGDYAAAKATCDEAIALGETLEQAVVLIDDYKVRAIIALCLEEFADAAAFAQKTLSAALPDKRYIDLRDGFSMLAQICCRCGKFADAAQWVGACQSLTEQHELREFDRWLRLEDTITELRRSLGDIPYEQYVAQGYERTLDDAIALSLRPSP